MASPAVIGGLALLVLGGGGLGYGLTRGGSAGPGPGAAASVTLAVGAIDSEIKVTRASVEQRARTMAEVDRVRAAVGTDAVTAMDMVGKELAFKPAAGEVIELGQVPRGAAPVPVSLLVLPAGAARSAKSGAIGAFVEVVGADVRVVQTVEVTPSDPAIAASLGGYVSVSKPVTIQPTLDALVAAGVSGRLEIGGVARPFGPTPDAATEVTPIPADAATRLIVAPIRAAAGGVPVAVVGGGAGAAGLGLILVLAGLMTGKDRARRLTAATAAANPLALGITDTALSGTGLSAPASAGASGMLTANNLGVGATVGRWEIVRRLGSGGMADVYLAHSKGEAGFEKLVAIKVMHPHLARMPRAVDHFLDEARLAVRVQHPNVVAIQDLGKIGEDYVIVMEYVDGIDLDKLLASARIGGRPVPLDVALGILRRVADGLHAAHTATSADGSPLGIIHRDVKSANVLVSKQGGVKVVDFGIAKANVQNHLTMVGETKGTPSVMPPEQRTGDHVDVRADVYTLGAVAYEILTGQTVNLDLAALAHLGIENWPHLPAPSDFRPDLPRELDALVLSTMAFDRERRPASCADLETAFEGVMKQHGLSASDKEIGRWVEFELARLQSVPEGGGGSSVS